MHKKYIISFRNFKNLFEKLWNKFWNVLIVKLDWFKKFKDKTKQLIYLHIIIDLIFI